MLILNLCILIIHTFTFSHYPKSYEDSRIEFEKIALKVLNKNNLAEFKKFSIPTNTNIDLAIDYLYIPQKNKPNERLLILTSGIHGVEAPTGSAIEIAFINKILDSNITDNMGLLIVHNINPYGYYFNRRVTENNIDLNRNFIDTSTLKPFANEAYNKFNGFLNPTGKVSSSWINKTTLFFKAIFYLIVYGKKQLTQAIVGGQYQFPIGIYYGGSTKEPNVLFLEKLFNEKGNAYSKILHIDLHTGYGERGRLHFFSNKTVLQLKGFNELFSGFSIDSGDDKDFYNTMGSFDQFTLNVFDNKTTIPMTFEFGTMNSQTILGSFYSLKNMIYENQGLQYGFDSNFSKEVITRDFLDMFNPSDEKWRAKVVNEGNETLLKLANRFSIF
jgi:hypothetical protein